MFDEASFLGSVEGAGPDELTDILRRPSADEESALRSLLGDDRYQRMHRLALRRDPGAMSSATKGNVVVIPDFMGSNLTAVGPDHRRQEVWLHPRLLSAGDLRRLRLSADGRSDAAPEDEISPSGILKRYYGELVLSLSQSGRWNVRTFWYDWRKDVRLAAAQLDALLRGWFADGAPVHLVGHGLGGVVARVFIEGQPERWESLWDAKGGGAGGGRLIMLGTPNRGSFAAAQAIMGVDPLVRKLAQLDRERGPAEVRLALNSFVSTYQMLPAPGVAGAAPLYSSTTYGSVGVDPRRLEDASRLHDALAEVVDVERMVNVLGNGESTPNGIRDPGRLDQPDGYEVTLRGDGRVSHELAHLERDSRPVPSYFVDENHADLISSPAVLFAIDELLETGQSDDLSGKPASGTAVKKPRGGTPAALDDRPAEPPAAAAVAPSPDDEFVRMVARLRGGPLSGEDRRVGELLTRGLLSSRSGRRTGPSSRIKPATLRVVLVYGSIAELEGLPHDGPPIDAIAVGHYLGVKPQAAELALDRAISETVPRTLTPKGSPRADAELLITQLTERSIVRGELGQPFFLPDPRGGQDGAPARLIALAGMGVPGRFGTPELTVLARELCWSLGQLGREHLAAVLIGAGVGNLEPDDAVAGWLRGAKNALSGTRADDERRIRQITFVERDVRKLQSIEEAIVRERDRLKEADRLTVDYIAVWTGKHLDDALALDRKWELDRERKRARLAKAAVADPGPSVAGREPAPTRLTLSLERNTYRFGAITDAAAVPEREIHLDPVLVMRANDELAAETNPVLQAERGQFLERLLVPDDLRPQLYTATPLVISLDSTTARIHWELLAQSESSDDQRREWTTDDAETSEGSDVSFLSIGRGLTRQLRSTFAPPPEPPPPPRRVLRVLVVADPAEDAHLPGAEEEGAAIVELFEAFNRVHEGVSENRVEVVGMFGPREATRTNVLRAVIMRTFDVLHFAGHCTYVRSDPSDSGWVFSNGERLTARELYRIDRVPSFVFSNACESGVTPDRSGHRSVELAPSFAEAFFRQGVTNFVCTAWPVDDGAAREFALALYAGLLGLDASAATARRSRPAEPLPMHKALATARQQIRDQPYGVGTWGAYQHYGNPYFRFFAPLPPQTTGQEPGGG